MEKRELKLRKEMLSNLTNLNIREMEEIKGGVAAQELAKTNDASLSVTVATITISVTITLTWSQSWSW